MAQTKEPGPVVHFERITARTVREICKLSETLAPHQRRMVADNALSIAQAHFSENAWFRAIYADGIDCPGVFLWRFMIAGPYQGRGYGTAALKLLVEHLRAQGFPELYTQAIAWVRGARRASIEPSGSCPRASGTERSWKQCTDSIALRDTTRPDSGCSMMDDETRLFHDLTAERTASPEMQETLSSSFRLEQGAAESGGRDSCPRKPISPRIRGTLWPGSGKACSPQALRFLRSSGWKM